jgi:hypothetical protein
MLIKTKYFPNLIIIAPFFGSWGVGNRRLAERDIHAVQNKIETNVIVQGEI